MTWLIGVTQAGGEVALSLRSVGEAAVEADDRREATALVDEAAQRTVERFRGTSDSIRWNEVVEEAT